MLSPPPPFLAEIGRTQKVHAKSPPPFLVEKKVKGGGGLSMKSTVYENCSNQFTSRFAPLGVR